MKVTNETRALAHEILAYWLRFNKHDQATWVGNGRMDARPNLVKKEEIDGKEYNVCNTTMCAAGTAVFLSNPPEVFIDAVKHFGYFDWMDEGAKALGLDGDEARLVFLSDEKSAKRFMRAIAAGSQKKFDKATEKRVALPTT